VKNQCPDCSGEGRVRGDTSVTLDIPAGVDTGMTMRVPGAGAAGYRRGPSGDLLVHMNVGSDPRFERDGADVRSDTNLSLVQSVLGTTKTIKGLDSEIDLKVTPGTLHGQVVRLRGKGMPKVDEAYGRGGRGDHFVEFRVEMPSGLTERQKELLQEFEMLEGAKTSGAKAAASEGKPKTESKPKAENKPEAKEEDKGKDKGFFDKLREKVTGSG
jgi:molecular chaperone DnaJ